MNFDIFQTASMVQTLRRQVVQVQLLLGKFLRAGGVSLVNHLLEKLLVSFTAFKIA